MGSRTSRGIIRHRSKFPSQLFLDCGKSCSVISASSVQPTKCLCVPRIHRGQQRLSGHERLIAFFILSPFAIRPFSILHFEVTTCAQWPTRSNTKGCPPTLVLVYVSFLPGPFDWLIGHIFAGEHAGRRFGKSRPQSRRYRFRIHCSCFRLESPNML